jgi:hypothetical protein
MIPARSKYFPLNLAVASAPGEKVYEFLVVWDHEINSLPKILEVFSRHKAKVLLAHSQADGSEDKVIGTFFYNLATADESADKIGKEIKKLSFVRTVEVAGTENSLFDKFLFPVTVWGKNRVLVMRMAPLLHIESRLKEELGSAGSAIMFREGEGYAAETLSQYRQVLGKFSPDSLLENAKDGLRATGWGIFDFKRTKDGYDVTVEDAPLVEGMTEPSGFVCGIIAGILESIYLAKLRIVQAKVDPKNGRAFVKLARTGDSPAA